MPLKAVHNEAFYRESQKSETLHYSVPPVRPAVSLWTVHLSPGKSFVSCQARFEIQTETESQAGSSTHLWHLPYQALNPCETRQLLHESGLTY